MTIYLFTLEGEFKELEKFWITVTDEEPEGSFILDTSQKLGKFRYGRIRQKQWESKPFYTFPSEFKTILLLLGVH